MSGIGKMLVKHSNVQFPLLVYFVAGADCGQNIEGEVLTLPAAHARAAIDRAGARLDNKGFEAATAAVELVNLYKEAFEK